MNTILLSLCLVMLPAVADEAPKPLSSWITQLQTLAGRHRKGDTQAQTDATFEAFVAALAKEHEGRAIQFTTTIKDVKWKDGIATLVTEDEYGKLPAPTPGAPLRIFRSHPFELRMSQADAVAIKAGTALRFTGRVNFHAGRWGTVGTATKSQQLYTLRHQYLNQGFAGTFTSSDGKYQVGGTEYPSRWATEK
jgi:hypothetical protein